MVETKFDDDEQNFIVYLNSDTEEKRIENYLDPSLKNISIEVIYRGRKVFFKFAIQSDMPTPKEIEWMIKESDKLQLILVKLTRLVTYLEANKLAYSFIPAHQQESKINFGRCPINSKSVGYEVYDPKTIDGLINIVNKIILPTPFLKLCKNFHSILYIKNTYK